MAARPRGRPRSYDPEQALEYALHAFWKGGYSGTSLDALAAATGLNRPSLYAGLGDKRAIYLKAMRRFQAHARERFATALAPRPDDRSFADVAARYLHEVIEVDGPREDIEVRGCAVMSTALAEALTDPEIRQILDDVLEEMDSQLRACLQAAVALGMLPRQTDVEALGFLLVSAAHSIGIRARAGKTRAEMEKQADALVRLIASIVQEGSAVRAVPGRSE